ncbi:MAG: fumarylacetoacetate hydrolase family protein [Deltaproteobacteria bacterium]|nr:fumarylacetoacetate hydrolase family protein [Deltaproteobacteria bacterium]
MLVDMDLKPKKVFGFGLTYPGHIAETQCGYSPGKIPPIFKKGIIALNPSHDTVYLPTHAQIISALEKLEPGIDTKIKEEYGDIEIPPMVDYEVELAMVLLENVAWEKLPDENYMPAVGYFLANDISARSLAVIGEGMNNRYDYWGASKSFPGFLPLGKKVWVPDVPQANATFCTILTTKVNGEIRQQQTTEKLLYTPKEMLSFIYTGYNSDLPMKGDIILTGTPSGVALQVPKWKRCLANFFGIGRFTKLAKLIEVEKDGKLFFLKDGDRVEISGGVLGSISVAIRDTKID